MGAAGSSWSSAAVAGVALSGMALGLVLGSVLGRRASRGANGRHESGAALRSAQERIAAVTPYYPFKGIDRFYDISGFLREPEVFQLVVDLFAERFRDLECDAICGIDARGFVLGPPLALALRKPFFMVRKANKLPSCITGAEYRKEYAGDDRLSVPLNAVKPGDKVVVIDDLIATGGSAGAALELVRQLGGEIVGLAAVIEIKALGARQRLDDAGFGDVEIFTVIEEDLLTLDGTKAV